ncbi:TPA: hypothetical protein ACRVDV_002613, partial [Staphylococcus aureus]
MEVTYINETSDDESKESRKDKINPILVSICYLMLGVSTLINIIRYFDINQYENSLLKEILDQFASNFLFSLNVSTTI